MKKLFTILLAIIMLAGFDSFGQRRNSLGENGFFLNIGTFQPGKLYGISKAFDIKRSDVDENPNKLGFNLEFGNYFKITDIDNHSLQLKISWFEANYSKVKDVDFNIVQASLFKLGPNFTYVLDREMGIDAYLQVAPVAFSLFDDDNDMSAIGVLGTFGAAFRYTKFTAGMNLNFGNAKDIDSDEITASGLVNDDYAKYKIGSFRIYLGMKF